MASDMAKTRWAALAVAAMAAVAITSPADAQTPDAGSRAARTVAFNRALGPGWFDSVIALPDGGFALAGREFETVGPGQARTRGALVVRLDRKGDVVWRKSFGSPAAPRWAMSITALPGGHFDVAGTAHVDTKTLEWWAELDGDGNLIKDVMTSGDGRSRSMCVSTPSTGGIFKSGCVSNHWRSACNVSTSCTYPGTSAVCTTITRDTAVSAATAESDAIRADPVCGSLARTETRVRQISDPAPQAIFRR